MDVSTSCSGRGILANTLILSSCVSVLATIIYRLILHPLARFPGPKLAAVTGWYETYYDCFLLGKFSKHIDRLHQTYGPVVRINPWEIHIKDPAFFDQIYTNSIKFDKDPWYYKFIGITQSTFATPDSRRHRFRRRAMSNQFSSSMILNQQPFIESCVAKLIASIKNGKPGQPINLSQAYWCLANDVVTGCMMSRTSGLLDDPSSAPQFGKMFKALASIALRNRHFSWPFSILLWVPRGIVRQVAPAAVLDSLNMEHDLHSQCVATAASHNLNKSHLTPLSIPHAILSSSLPPSEKSLPRLTQESTMIVGAGTEAVGAALSITTFYLLADPAKTHRLKAELCSLQPSSPSGLLTYHQLRQCTYLSASISEGLRLSKESNRLPRINPSHSMFYYGLEIPAGTVVSMSLRDIHLDESIYASPYEFQPERWLQSNDCIDEKEKVQQERYFVPFGRGSRGCVGREMAMVELFLVLGNLFREVEVGLWETCEEDIRVVHDFFSVDGGLERVGLRVVVG